jgi:high-affinity nickel-transport protein
VFDAIARFNFIGIAGFVIVGMFVLTWILALSYFKYARVEERWTARLEG